MLKFCFISILIMNIYSVNGKGFPSSFICEKECSKPGLNQLNINHGEYKIYASLTPKQKQFSKGWYTKDTQNIFFIDSGNEISFKIVNDTLERDNKILNVYRLVWVSGESDYFKKGIKFVETIPALYGVPTKCMVEFEQFKDNKECEVKCEECK